MLFYTGVIVHDVSGIESGSTDTYSVNDMFYLSGFSLDDMLFTLQDSDDRAVWFMLESGAQKHANLISKPYGSLNRKDDFMRPSGWASEPVSAAAKAGLLRYLTGNPGYQDAITREQFAELVVRAVSVICNTELEAAPEGTFADTKNPAVLQAYQAGIVQGTGSGAFSPAGKTDREQIATMIYRALQFIKDRNGTDLTPKTGSIDGFADRNHVSSWATEAVGALAANGIMNGTAADTLSPHDACTVEQSIVLLYRAYQAAQ